jgi:hypothetical protein
LSIYAKKVKNHLKYHRMPLITLFDFVGDDADVLHAHVFIAAHWCFEVEIFEVTEAMARVSLVEIMLLMRHLAVVRLAVGVLTFPG